MTEVASYFDEVIASLTTEDTQLLGVLLDEDATAKFKAVPYRTAMTKGKLSEAILRKSVARLTALQFIVLRTDSKEHGMFITLYGQTALQKILSMVEGN
jgi:RIO-like serine/threonine protein kinase